MGFMATHDQAAQIQTSIQEMVIALAKALSERKAMLAVAESCTGGAIAKVCTDLAGSSQWFEGGVVTYSNRAKHRLLQVPENTIETHGAVSKMVSEAMVSGLLNVSRSDWGVSVTGIAGPSGGSDEKPVGTVWIAWQNQHHSAESSRFHFEGDRSQVRSQTVYRALEGLLTRILA